MNVICRFHGFQFPVLDWEYLHQWIPDVYSESSYIDQVKKKEERQETLDRLCTKCSNSKSIKGSEIISLWKVLGASSI